MSENAVETFRPLDPGRINVMDPHEVRYWCGVLHCSQETLVEAVDDVGEHVAAVRARLEDSPPASQA